MTAILETDSGQRAILQAMLHGSTAVETVDDLAAHVQETQSEFAVVIGPSITTADAATFAQWARVNRPDLGVILLRDTVDSDALTLALRSGMREVVQSRDLPGITTAVQRARSVATAIGQTMHGEVQAAAEQAKAQFVAEAEAEAAAAEEPQGKLLHGVLDQGWRRQEPGRDQHGSGPRAAAPPSLPGRPGRQQRRRGDHAPAVPDAERQRPGRLRGQHRRGLHPVPPDAVLRQPVRRCCSGAPRLAGSGLRRGDRTACSMASSRCSTSSSSTPQASSTTKPWRHSIDPTRSSWSAPSTSPPSRASSSPPSTLDLLNFPRESWSFVLNRADAKVGLTQSDFESTLGLKAQATLVSSREVLAAVNRGEPLVTAFPGNANSKAFGSFATSLANAHRAGNGSAPQRKPHRLRLRKG